MTYIAEIERITGLKGVTITPRKTKSQDSSGKNIERNTSVFDITAPSGSPATQVVHIGHFQLCQLPGCCGVCLSFQTRIEAPYLRKGLGKVLMKLKEQIAWDNGYTLMLATDKTKNTAQAKIFTGAKWAESAQFCNRRTRNTVGVYTKVLEDSRVMTGCNQLYVQISP